MAEKPLTTEAIALTEKKMDMSLDDIIKMSKKNTTKGKRPPRVSNKSRGFQNLVAPQGNSRVKKFMDSRSSIRQGVLAQRRTNFHANQFPLTTEVARKAAVAPIHNRIIKYKPRVVGPSVQRSAAGSTTNGKENELMKPRPQTLDALFANMKQQRMMNKQTVSGGGRGNSQRHRGRQLRQQRGRGGAPLNTGYRLGSFK
uniref:UAP56-interacting factor n=1 Tax=Anthurium amnicola TaxID=1678845 RepID=A0A1D1XHU8_9ARAE